MFVSRLASSTTRLTYRGILARHSAEFNKSRHQYYSFTIGTRCFSVDDKDINTHRSLNNSATGPTLEEVKSSPLCITNAKNETIIRLAAENVPAGCVEQLKRHIMIVESVEYPEASKRIEIVREANKNISPHLALPNKAGVIASVSGAFLSFPLCFHYPTVNWFNEYFVTADVPEPKDLETCLEVGAWAWNWMEPVMGQLSFLLLCLAFARSQFKTLGISPFSAKIKDQRARVLVKEFPMYDEKIVSDYSRSQPFDWALVRRLRLAISG